MNDRRDVMLSLEQALADVGVGYDDENLDRYNAFDPERFTNRVGELIDAHPEAAELRRNKRVPEDQPLGRPVAGETVILVPRDLLLAGWALSERRFEDPVDVFVHRSSDDPGDVLHVGVIRREEVRRLQS